MLWYVHDLHCLWCGAYAFHLYWSIMLCLLLWSLPNCANLRCFFRLLHYCLWIWFIQAIGSTSAEEGWAEESKEVEAPAITKQEADEFALKQYLGNKKHMAPSGAGAINPIQQSQK